MTNVCEANEALEAAAQGALIAWQNDRSGQG